MTPEELVEVRARFDAQKYITEAEIGGLFAVLDEHQGEKAVWLEDRRQWERTANDLATQVAALRGYVEDDLREKTRLRAEGDRAVELLRGVAKGYVSAAQQDEIQAYLERTDDA